MFHQRMLARRCRAVNAHALQRQKLQQCRADPAGRTRDQRARGALNASHAMDHLPGADVIEDHGGGFDVRDAIGDWHKVARLAREIFGKAAMDCQRSDALADMKAVHALADRVDLARDLVAADDRQLRRETIVARKHDHVG